MSYKEIAIHIGVVHIFHFERDKIAEFWDTCQVVPDEAVKENGMF